MFKWRISKDYSAADGHDDIITGRVLIKQLTHEIALDIYKMQNQISDRKTVIIEVWKY